MENEQTGLAAAEQQAALLATTGMAWDRMILAHRAFVINKASYAWVGRFPTLSSSEKLFSSLSRALMTGYVAARALWLLYGGAVLLNTIVLNQAWKRLRTDRGMGLQNEWHNAARSALGLVRRGLKKLAFVEQDPWSGGCQEQSQDLQLHVIRSQARRGWLEGYSESGRHETEEMLRSASRPQLRKAFREIDLKKTRQLVS